MQNFVDKLFHIPEETGVHPEVVTNFKRNFIVNFLDVAFYFFGDSFVAAYTILPVFVSTLTESPIIIGLVPAIYEAGWFLPQVFFASFVQKQNRLVPVVIKFGLFERLSFLLLAVGAFFLPYLDHQVALWVVMLLIIWKSLFSGFYALPWQEVIAKAIPFSHRGRLFGWANVFGKLLSLSGAVITGIILTRLAYPKNYALVFAIGFVVVMISLVVFSFTKEPVHSKPALRKEEGVDLKTSAVRIIKTNRSFRYFLISRALSFLGFMAYGFMAVYSIERFSLPESYAAMFTGILVVFTMVGYALLGVIGDQRGNKLVFVYGDLFLVFSIAIALVWQTLIGIYVMFALIGLAHAGAMIGDMNMAMEFGSEDQRPTFIGLSKTLTGPFFLFAPLIGGGIVSAVGYQAMFSTAFVFSILALAILLAFVKEPRYQGA